MSKGGNNNNNNHTGGPPFWPREGPRTGVLACERDPGTGRGGDRMGCPCAGVNAGPGGPGWGGCAAGGAGLV